MGAMYSDTDPKVEALQIEMWRQASPTRKMHMLAQLNASLIGLTYGSQIARPKYPTFPMLRGLKSG